jgi:minor extracellular serine protease Vpr
MPRRAETGHAGLLAVFGVVVTALVVAVSSEQPLRAAAAAPSVSWEGLAGAPHVPVALGQRMIVVLKARSLADRVAAAGGRATDGQERAWTASVLSQQHLLLTRLALQGVNIQPEFSFARVLAGFSAPLDARAVALLERDAAVQGVYPVRVAYPASISSSALTRKNVEASLGNADLALPGYDGRGVTIALLDTGVDRVHPSLLGSVTDGIDVVDPNGDAMPQAPPGRPADLEHHGTELAGILVGDRGPAGTNGVATGATLLPIRVAGWQPDARSGWSIYARTDQLIEGLERAVDPNADGDAHDAARIALVGVAAPFAAFPDDPAARAVAGATRLDTLVVVPAGNDGPAGPGFGSVAGPGGSPSALTVGAADGRSRVQQVQVTLRSGLKVVLARTLPLSGELAPAHGVDGSVVAPGLVHPDADLSSLDSYFTRDGLSLVAGRVALVSAGTDPAAAARNAARAGATAVILYGARLPAGGVPLDEETPVPVVSIPSAAASRLLAAIAHDALTSASIGPARDTANDSADTVAGFSSTGLAFDGRVKPNVVAPGVGVATAEPGAADDGSPRFGTVSGTSAAAAAVAGAAAVLTQARPELDAASLASVLAGEALPLKGENVEAQGAGFVALGRAAAAEIATEPTSLAFGNARVAGWKSAQTIVVRNVSTRTLRVRVTVERSSEGAAAVLFRLPQRVLTLPPGVSHRVTLSAHVTSAPIGAAPAEGDLLVTPVGDSSLRVPWAITFDPAPDTLLGPLSLSSKSFVPSDTAPALLRFQAGRVLSDGALDAVAPVAALRLDLLRGDGSLVGNLVTLRDLLPGRYAFGLTGRGPVGNRLVKGNYIVRVTAVPSLPGPASHAKVAFTIK